MGNRGCLHNERGEIVRPFVGKRWIACLLDFRGRRRAVMTPGRYTELFFLDEVTALAAGHRPCAECRREEYNVFRRAWVAAGLPSSGPLPSANEMDAHLHAERLDGRGDKATSPAPHLFSHPTLPLSIPERELNRLLPHCGGGWVGVSSYPAKLANLPEGVFVIGEASDQPLLFFDNLLWPWTPEGYAQPTEALDPGLFRLLTPGSIAAMLTAGYTPAYHPSVSGYENKTRRR